jgi:CheY-like chemotaxis protein
MVEENEILLVEDDPADVELALHALHENHLANHIRVLRDGEEALEYLFGPGANGLQASTLLPRLILLDLKLPKVNGLEVLRLVKNNARTKYIPVVILTASNEERDLVRGYDLGVNSYLQKPVDFNRFRELVARVGLYWLVTNRPVPVHLQPMEVA